MRELLGPASTSDEIDLRGLTIVLSLRGGESAVFVYETDATEGQLAFTARVVRDADGSFGRETPILNDSDLVEVALPVGQAQFAIAPRDALSQEVYRGAERVLAFAFDAPPSFGDGALVDFIE